MSGKKVWIWLVGLVCGAQLFAVVVVGGAGIGAFFGPEGALVLSIAAGAAFFAIRSLVSRTTPNGSSEQGH